MIYILLDNFANALVSDEVKDFDALAEYLRKFKESGENYDRIEQIIFGEEVPWEVVKQYYHLEE